MLDNIEFWPAFEVIHIKRDHINNMGNLVCFPINFDVEIDYSVLHQKIAKLDYSSHSSHSFSSITANASCSESDSDYFKYSVSESEGERTEDEKIKAHIH